MVIPIGRSTRRPSPKNNSSAKKMSNGVVIRVTKLFTVVMEMDKATFPRRRYVIRLEVAPPGHAAMITIPTLISEGKSAISAIKNANAGRMIS